MSGFLDNLRARPLKERKRIALGSTISIFTAIFIVWWITFTSPVDHESIATTSVISPLGVIGNVVQATKEGIVEIPNKIMNDIQYNASGTNARLQQDIVYPDQMRTQETTPTAHTATQTAPLLAMPPITPVSFPARNTSVVPSSSDAPLIPTRPNQASPQAD